MHQYLRAVGFSDIKTKSQLKDLMNDVLVNSGSKDFLKTERDSIVVEYSKSYSPSAGLCLVGEYDDEEKLTLDYYFPFVKAHNVSTNEDITIERHAAKESFAGACEDYRVGVTLIFYVQNGLESKKKMLEGTVSGEKTSTSFSGLSLNGTILFPIKKNAEEKAKIKKAVKERTERIVAAKQGDEEAIEKLTIEDIDTYSALSRRILKEDVFSLVDSYFMPFGVECDQYSIMGEIEDVTLETNYLTEEKIYILDVNCNGLPVTVGINAEDLVGEPMIGRRFRGNVWLQGLVTSI